MIYFTAHTFKCVCHCIRTMFRVLGVYNFESCVKFKVQLVGLSLLLHYNFWGVSRWSRHYTGLRPWSWLICECEQTFKYPTKYINIQIRVLLEITSSLEVRKIYKIQAVQKPEVFPENVQIYSDPVEPVWQKFGCRPVLPVRKLICPVRSSPNSNTLRLNHFPLHRWPQCRYFVQ